MIRPLLCLLLLATPLLSADVASFTIKTMTAQMKYDRALLLVKPGQLVKIHFENGDDLPHNIVFCAPGTDTAAMSLRQMEKPDEALKRNWLPDDKRIWQHSKMLNPHEAQDLRFTAPTKPGSYPYVCTFPGHALTMRGELRVAPMAATLHDLSFSLYLGSWKKLPDFTKLTPHRSGKVADNLIQVKLDDYKNEFGVVYTGRLTTPKKGSYRFYLACDDGARLLIDGKELINHDGIHPASEIKEAAVQLDQGEHEYRLEYFQAAGEVALYAAWKGADTQITPLSKWLHPKWKTGTRAKRDFAPIPLTVAEEPVIYRNFIQGAGNRGIGVGFPGGINMAWSAESMNLALLWRGAFIDAARHWNARGAGHEKPLGYDVLHPTGQVTPAFFVADKPDAAWPAWDSQNGLRHDGFAWKGYTLDSRRSPAFRYTWHGAEMEETYTTAGDGNRPDGSPALTRTVKISGTLPEHAWFRVAEAGKMEESNGEFACQEGSTKFRVQVSGAQIAGRNLVLPARTGTLTITYLWGQ